MIDIRSDQQRRLSRSDRYWTVNRQRSDAKPRVSMILDNRATERGVFTLSVKVDQVFVMRFWQEFGCENAADSNRWRVRIRHVNSRQQLYAVGLEAAFSIVRSTLTTENGSNGKEST